MSGNPVKSEVSIEHEGKTIHFCCAGCGSRYEKDPAKHKTALANAYTYQTQCPVSGEKIDPKTGTELATGEMVYFCGKDCEKKFLEAPEKFAPKLAEQGVSINVKRLKEASKSD